MNFKHDEPRKVPKPMPFSQSSPLQPTVPEVSLILQEGNCSADRLTKSFPGTEFQTYNAWRWKNVNDREKSDLASRTHTNVLNPYVLRDRFADSDIERRKNEILYGSQDEPRRPLPPRQIPDIPKCLETSFADFSFTDHRWMSDSKNEKDILPRSSYHSLRNSNLVKNVFEVNKTIKESSTCELYDIRDLYKIISEQNRQMSFFQQQIKKLLATQDVKERQIEQLLKTQETKENKIEQLLKIQEMKENYIEQLVKAQEKQEKQIEQLVQSQENKEQEKIELQRQYIIKECVSVGVMTEVVKTAEKGINATVEHKCCRNGVNADIKNVEERPSAFTNVMGKGEKSLTLNSVDLPSVEEQLPSPQSSIHVDIPEYNDSSDEETAISTPMKKQLHMPESKSMGYTFYNNIITKVNDIIQSHENKENAENPTLQHNYKKLGFEVNRSDPREYSCLRENNFNVIRPSAFIKDNIEQFWQLRAHEEDITDIQQGGKFSNNSSKDTGSSAQGRSDTKDNQQSPSDISLKMNALALKYLNKEQISNYHIESESKITGQQSSHDVTIYNVTNLSFGTMSYFERYRMSSGTPEGANGVHSPHQLLRKRALLAVQNNMTKNL